MTAANGYTEVRALIRELILESLPAIATVGCHSVPPREARPVRIETDADVSTFVQTIISILDDPLESQRLRAGALVFHLGSAPPAGVDETATTVTTPALRVDRGAVTEKIVASAAAANRPISLSTRAVLTPLGREKARKLGVEIRREP